MKLADTDIHLTYCLNVHPGDTWQENFAAIQQEVREVRKKVCRNRPFGLGLRLAAQAADTLQDPQQVQALRDYLQDEQLYAFTVNAFPYGVFHSAPVKENVYRPDWTNAARLEYTLKVADILATLLPADVEGSISTVPVSYKGFHATRGELGQAADNLIAAVGSLDTLERRTGKRIVLALEPEPGCTLETTDDFLEFYATVLLPAADHCKGGEQALRRHLGICFDTAHAAVQFEEISTSLSRLAKAGVKIAKIQISSALTADGSSESLKKLEGFAEPVYLHQTAVRRADGALLRFADLSEALATVPPADGNEWRVHYHVPLFWQGNQELGSTAKLIPAAVKKAISENLTKQLEIETYTFTVLPETLAPPTLAEGIAGEFNWLLAQLNLKGVDTGTGSR